LLLLDHWTSSHVACSQALVWLTKLRKER